jgi:UDP-N-acetylmuramoyl-tripeptide--D-alanyl-D-alanine ligase
LVQIKQGLESVHPVNGRLCPRAGQLGNIVIDDTYNANFASLNAALAVLMDCDGEPWVALGAFGELGPESSLIHQDMGKQMKALGVKKLFATGDDARHSVEAFGDGGVYYETQQALIDALKSEQKGQEAILVKGSRFQRMENVVNAIV